MLGKGNFCFVFGLHLKMWHHSLLVLKLLQFAASAPAPAPDITYDPTKEAPCAVIWNLQSNGATEHYEVLGHCMFKDSTDKLCSGGYRAPGFCPSGMYKISFYTSPHPTPRFIFGFDLYMG